ncbi:Beta-lactamase domain-containing 2 [Fusarium albosuccineum]|uniref:Beta-lactamase domain-containing 2 n=1 Tax=Fusarium albosuccineum TaxID=1237068 RepID=A0A8H4LMD0_9HYPO|nr:Beta-lactamase domain-containing 2 [Fusarium albosuccineum]
MESLISASDPRIARALQAILDRGVTGVSVTAYYRGKPVIEAAAGYADTETKRPVDRDTLFSVFSTTKGITALAVHIQAEKGLLRLDDPIAKHWPEFGVNGKENITIEDALSHRSGIPYMPEGVTPELMADWQWMTERIANYTPIFPPGKANAYHVLVYGWILGEVVRRTDPQHRPFGQFVREELCEPLGVKDLFLGVPDSELHRVATLYGKNQEEIKDQYHVNPMPVFPGPRQHNLRAMRQAVDPGAGARTSSAALARIFSMVAEGGELDGVRLLSQDRVKRLPRPREGMREIDEIFTGPVPFAATGFWLGGQKGMSDPLVGDHEEIVFSSGAGGSIVWADIRDRLAVAIVNNHMDAGVSTDPEPIWAGLGRAIREVIADMQDI